MNKNRLFYVVAVATILGVFAIFYASFRLVKYKSFVDVKKYLGKSNICYVQCRTSVSHILIFTYKWEDEKRASLNYYYWHFTPWGSIVHESTPD